MIIVVHKAQGNILRNGITRQEVPHKDKAECNVFNQRYNIRRTIQQYFIKLSKRAS